MRRRVWLLAVGLLLFAGGCGRFNTRRQPSPFLSKSPTADEVVAALNRNANLARSLWARDLDISVSGVPLDGQLALEKPRRFRLKARSVVGTEADLGSNEEEFWFFIPRASERPALVHCNYEDYGRIQSSLPFQPDWVFDSIGLTAIEPDQNHSLRPGRRGTVELITPTRTPQGQPASLVTVVALDSGWILERHLDVEGRRIASAKLSRHHVDPAYGVVYPGTIQFRWPEQGVDFSISLDDVEVNPVFPSNVAQNLWRIPHEVIGPGVDDVDLGASAALRSARPRSSRPPASHDRDPGDLLRQP
jgi:hypothetical protein